MQPKTCASAGKSGPILLEKIQAIQALSNEQKDDSEQCEVDTGHPKIKENGSGLVGAGLVGNPFAR